MKFKNWKEAEKRAAELKTEFDAIYKTIETDETAARVEDLDVEKRDALIIAIQGNVAKRDALQAEYNEAVEASAKLKDEETRQFGLLANVTGQKVTERNKKMETSIYETRSYELAWAKYIRDNDDAEVRSLISTEQDTSAGVLVPTVLMNAIADKIMTGGRLVYLCDVAQIPGVTEWPVVQSKTSPAWHAEVDSEGKPTKKVRKAISMGTVSIEPEFVAEILETTKKFEALTIEAFWSWILAELPDAIMRVLDAAIISAPTAGTYGIRGIITNTDAKFVATLANHTLNFNTANSAVAMLDEPGRLDITAVMHKDTFFNNIMGLKDLSNRPIFRIMENNTERPAYFFGSYPVVFTEELPSYDTASAGETYLIMGDFKAMKLNFPQGMGVQITRDALTRKDENIVEYLSEVLVGGNIVHLGSFVMVTK